MRTGRSERKNEHSLDAAYEGPMDLLRIHEKAQRYCNLCPRLCHHSCPVSNAERDEAVTPGNKNLVAGQVAQGRRDLDEGAADLFYKCVTCGLCTSVCEHDNDIAESLLSARAAAVEAGIEAPAAADLRRSFERHGNAWLEDLAPRLRDLVPRELRVGEGGSISESPRPPGPAALPGRGLRVYWPGCSVLARQPDLVSTALEVFARVGEPDVAVYCGDEAQCCGYPLLASGQHEAFVEQAKRASKALSGADVIFTSNPECAWTFSVAWPTRAKVAPPAPRVAHVVDLLLPALRHAPVHKPLDLDAVYHDPCYLGRHLGRYAEPRELINSVLRGPMAEAGSWSRDESYCCGAGGELETTSPETALRITRARVGHLLGLTSGPPGEASPSTDEPKAADDRCIVTACSRCSTRFREAGAEALDLIEVLARYLGVSGEREPRAIEAEEDAGE